jgi:DNA ligase 1
VFKPMLAGTLPLIPGTTNYDFRTVKFPVLVSPKIDGVRGTVQSGMVLSRTLKCIPNVFVQKVLGRPELEGLDGELTVGTAVGDDVFLRIDEVMTIKGEPDFTLWVFDSFGPEPFEKRLERAKQVVEQCGIGQVKMVYQKVCHSIEEVYKVEEKCLEMGFEGVMIRSLRGPYKQGRSTLNEGYLLKLKRWIDSEAIVIGFKEGKSNQNPAMINGRGNSARSHHQDGMVLRGTLGALLVRDVKTGVEFSLGASDERMANEVWQNRPGFLGKIAKYKSLPVGVKDRPRHPIFLDWRHEIDVEEAA